MTHSPHSLPPDDVDALRQGNKIEAIKRLRAAIGVGLSEAKAAVDAAERHSGFASGTHHPSAPAVGSRTTLSPGEVPRSSGNAIGYVVVAVVAALAGWLLGKFG